MFSHAIKNIAYCDFSVLLIIPVCYQMFYLFFPECLLCPFHSVVTHCTISCVAFKICWYAIKKRGKSGCNTLKRTILKCRQETIIYELLPSCYRKTITEDELCNNNDFMYTIINPVDNSDVEASHTT